MMLTKQFVKYGSGTWTRDETKKERKRGQI